MGRSFRNVVAQDINHFIQIQLILCQAEEPSARKWLELGLFKFIPLLAMGKLTCNILFSMLKIWEI